MSMRGLFTRPDRGQARPQDTGEQQPDPSPTPADSTPETATDEQETPHPDYPEWEPGQTAPRLFQRVGQWTPGTFPPPRDSDPIAVAGERYASHQRLWAAVRSWEREQDEQDTRAVQIHRADQFRRQRAEQEERDATAATEQAERQAAEYADRLQQIRSDAAAIGLAVHIDRDHQGRERVRLTTTDTEHPALSPRYPWEQPGMRIHAGGGLVVNRAGETMNSAEEFLADWHADLVLAEQERRDADREHRQRLLDAVRVQIDAEDT